MTPFENIYPLAMITIQDYRLDKLAVIDFESYLLHLESILVNASGRFYGCMQSLEYNLTTPPYFKNDLTQAEQDILADYMVLVWFTRNTNDVIQFNEGLQGKDKKSHAKSQNIKAKISISKRIIAIE